MNVKLPFLKEVASYVFTSYPHQYGDIHLVFPTKRSKHYFHKYFAEVAGKTVWAPRSYPITAFIQRLSGITLADRLTLLLELYEAFKQHQEKFSTQMIESFDRFYSLGEIVLNDFTDIDSYLVDYQQLYQNLSDLKGIDAEFTYFPEEQLESIKQFWRSFDADKSDEQQQFLELWENLPAVYETFSQRLLQKRIGHEGFIYRKLVEYARNNELNLSHYKNIIFCGFNALNKAQIELFDILDRYGKVAFYWDIDQYYIDDEKQEAGDFLRENRKKFGHISLPETLPSSINNSDKTITVISVSGKIPQAKALSNSLGGMSQEELSKTAVVLGEEKLLFPVLSALPENVTDVNVTMGFPVKDTIVYTLITSYLDMQTAFPINVIKEKGFYYKDVLALLNHPYVREFSPDICRRLVTEIKQNNRVYTETQFLTDEDLPVFQELFTVADEGTDMFRALLNMLYLNFERISGDTEQQDAYTVEQEYLYQAYLTIQRLKDTLISRIQNVNRLTAARLIREHLEDLTIPFEAESTEGLQVIGLMETRNLDFRNVFILGMNDGIIPKVNRPPSFISESLRRGFGLPEIKQQDAIFAYVFYRLLHRSVKVTLMYNNITDELSSGEESRFIKQLYHESDIQFRYQQLNLHKTPGEFNEIVVEKKKSIMQRLKQYISVDGYAQRHFTASAINTYLDCRLQFYFKYLAEINEPPEVEEDVSPLAFGELLHNAMKFLYTDLLSGNEQEIIREKDLKETANNIEKALQYAFGKYYKTGQKNDLALEGNQLVIWEVLKEYITNIIKQDMNYAPFEVYYLEEGYNIYAGIDISVNGAKQKVMLKGIFDRVDKVEDIIRIVDYKTGHVEKAFNDVSDLFNRDKNNRQKHLLQIFFYVLLYLSKNKDAIDNILPAIYDLRSVNRPGFTPYPRKKEKGTVQEITPGDFTEYFKSFKYNLAEVIEEIFDENVSFDQTTDKRKCEYCPYRTICAR